jgi:hypothetical protein
MSGRPRVLCVAPRFAPANAADAHRLRLLLPHLCAQGWQIEVLAVDSRDVGTPCDPWLSERLPSGVPVHHVRAWPLRGWGLNGLAQRAYLPLLRRGHEILARGGFGLVFFSTTEFLLHALGPAWQRRWGVPFCMDLQDPWVNDYYREHPEVVPPGGRLKHGIMDRIQRAVEARVTPVCSGFLAVSEPYLADLARRHGPDVSARPQLVAAFPAEPAEFDGLQRARQPARQGPAVWRYVGRGGPDMARAAAAFFEAWRSALDAGVVGADDIRLAANGTSYAAAGRGEKSLEPLARARGLSAQVSESPDRLGYREMLQALVDSDALVVFGSDDPRYTASKIYPYLLARRPLLVIVHEASPVARLIGAAQGAVCVTFGPATTAEALALAVRRAWFDAGRHRTPVPLRGDVFESHTAKAQAEEVGKWWNRCATQPARA